MTKLGPGLNARFINRPTHVHVVEILSSSSCHSAEATTEDMPPLEGEEDDDASRMEEVD